MNQNGKIKWIAPFFFLPILVLIILIAIRSHHVTTSPESIPSVTAFASTYTNWASQVYMPISRNTEFQSKIEALSIKHACDISAAQEAGIHQSVYNLLMAFNSDSYQDYRTFRTPIPADFNLDQIAIEKQFCKEDWKNANHDVPDDAEGIFKRFWEVQYLNKYVPNPNVIKDSTIGQPLFRGIALETNDTAITIEEITGSLKGLKEYIDLHKHAGAAIYPSSFNFEHSPQSILKQKQKLKIATVECLIQYAKPEPPSPICVRFYWDDDNQVWLPCEFALAIPGLTRTRDLVF